MRLHGGLADVQLPRDLGVRAAAGDQHQHLVLRVGQPVDRRGSGGRVREVPRVTVEQPPQDARRDDRLPGRDDPDRVDQLVGRHVLRHEAAGPGSQRPDSVLVQVEHGEHQHPGAQSGLDDPPGGLHAVARVSSVRRRLSPPRRG
jgi:hypothetical protein